MSQPLSVHALGALRVSLSAERSAPLTQPRRLALLAYLLFAEPRGPHSRESLVALLWPESTTEQGRHALRNSLHAIRKAAGEGVIVTAGQDLVGVDRSLVACDVDVLEAHLAAGRILAAVEQYRELLDGFHVAEAAEFERWLDGARASLKRRVVQAALREADVLHSAGNGSESLRLAHAAHALDLDDERVLRRLLELSAANGDLAGAHRSYRAFVVRLAVEYDAQPANETVALMASLAMRYAGRIDVATTSIALLPIADATPFGEASAHCGALWDGVYRRLKRSADLRVLARSAVAPYADRSRSALSAASELGVDVVADGRLSVPCGSDELEVRLEIVDAKSGGLIRELTLRANPTNLFVLEGPMTAVIAPGLSLRSSPPPLARPARSTNEEAYLLYVRGNYLFLRAAHVGGRIEDLHQCRELFEAALARDAEFAPAYCGLSNYYAVCAGRGLLQPFAEHFGHAIELCDRALDLDPAQSIPHVHYGVQAMYLELDWVRAGEEFRRAVALDPDNAEGRRFFGVYLGAIGEDDESVRELSEACRIEPHSPQCRNSLADALLAQERYDEAIVELRIALELDAGFRAARDRLVRCLERSHRWAEAITERRAAAPNASASESAEQFARAFQVDGAEGYRRERKAELRASIAAMAVRAGGAPGNVGDLFNPVELQLALAHAELEEWDAAAEWQERASERQPGRRQWFTGRPELRRVQARVGPTGAAPHTGARSRSSAS